MKAHAIKQKVYTNCIQSVKNKYKVALLDADNKMPGIAHLYIFGKAQS